MKIFEITEAVVKPYEFENLGVKRAVTLLNQHCKESLSLIHNPIWRGMKNHNESILTIDPTTGERRSNNTSNYYTTLLDYSPYMKGWPLRSKSLICSTSHGYAINYGQQRYTIFPYDGVKIAVCPKQDIWETPIVLPEFGRRFAGGRGLSDFNEWLCYDLGFTWSDWKGMQAEVLTPAFQKRINADLHPNFKGKVTGPQFIDIIQRAFRPEQTGFELMTIAEFAQKNPSNKEVWIGGPVVAIKYSMYKQFVQAIKNQ
jgi:hypothetical protein